VTSLRLFEMRTRFGHGSLYHLAEPRQIRQRAIIHDSSDAMNGFEDSSAVSFTGVA
jgi:hypothetical protein